MIYKKESKYRPAMVLTGLFIFLLTPGLLLAAMMPPVQRTVLPNGLTLLVCQEHSLPFVTLQMIINAGSRLDPPGQEGLANLTARALMLGTSRNKAEAINEALDFMGASLEASANKDYVSLNLRVLKKDLAKGYDLLLDTLLRPTFPEEEVKREINKILGAIRSMEERPMALADKAFDQVLFPDNPYGHPVEGTKESLPGLTREEVLGFFKTYYRPNETIVSIVGDITQKEIEKGLAPLLSAWPKGEQVKSEFKAVFAKAPATIRISRDITQANIIIGGIGVERANPDYYTLMVMNYILGGGGFGSRLFDEIRVKKGLAYSVVSFFEPLKYQGTFQVVLQTKNSSAKEAVALALEQIRKIRQEPVSEEALERAKKYLVGSFPLRLDTQGKLAGFLAQVEYFGLGLDYPEKYPSIIRSITRQEVQRVALKYLDPERTFQVIVGNLKEAGLEDSGGKTGSGK